MRLSELPPADLWLWSVGQRLPLSEPINLREFVTHLRNPQTCPLWMKHADDRRYVLPAYRIDGPRYRAFLACTEVKATRRVLLSVEIGQGKEATHHLVVLADKLMACGHWLGEPLALWLGGSRALRRDARAKFRELAPDLAVFRGWQERERRFEQGLALDFYDAMAWLRESKTTATITRFDDYVSIMIGDECRLVRLPTREHVEFFHASPRTIEGKLVEWLGSDTGLVRPVTARE